MLTNEKKPMDRFTPAGHSWNVLYTKPNHEKKVSEILSKRNIKNYLPLKKVPAPWWVIGKEINLPLFDSIVFVKVDTPGIKELKDMDGVVNWLYWLGKPFEMNDMEIDQIREFLSTHSKIVIEKIEVPLSYTSIADDKHETIQSTLKIEVPALGYRLVAEQSNSNVMVMTFDKSVTPLNTPYSHAS